MLLELYTPDKQEKYIKAAFYYDILESTRHHSHCSRSCHRLQLSYLSDQETCSGLAFPGETSSGWERSLRFFLAPHLYHDDDDDEDEDDDDDNGGDDDDDGDSHHYN